MLMSLYRVTQIKHLNFLRTYFTTARDEEHACLNIRVASKDASEDGVCLTASKVFEGEPSGCKVFIFDNRSELTHRYTERAYQPLPKLSAYYSEGSRAAHSILVDRFNAFNFITGESAVSELEINAPVIFAGTGSAPHSAALVRMESRIAAALKGNICAHSAALNDGDTYSIFESDWGEDTNVRVTIVCAPECRLFVNNSVEELAISTALDEFLPALFFDALFELPEDVRRAYLDGLLLNPFHFGDTYDVVRFAQHVGYPADTVNKVISGIRSATTKLKTLDTAHNAGYMSEDTRIHTKNRFACYPLALVVALGKIVFSVDKSFLRKHIVDVKVDVLSSAVGGVPARMSVRNTLETGEIGARSLRNGYGAVSMTYKTLGHVDVSSSGSRFAHAEQYRNTDNDLLAALVELRERVTRWADAYAYGTTYTAEGLTPISERRHMVVRSAASRRDEQRFSHMDVTECAVHRASFLSHEVVYTPGPVRYKMTYP